MTVSQSLKKLIAEKLMLRPEHPNDTRAKSVQLTLKGKILIQALSPQIEDLDKEYFSKLDKAQYTALLHALQQLNGK
jgi:DNA-binding MarR family transcriptional regulator